MNIRLTLQYDGTGYHGWQIQSNGVTVEGELRKALEKITHERVKITGCGRTDAGVHAMNYVCNFHTDSRMPAERYPYALNTVLPEDIVCIGACEADEDFCSNRSAAGKRYIYRIWNTLFNLY